VGQDVDLGWDLGQGSTSKGLNGQVCRILAHPCSLAVPPRTSCLPFLIGTDTWSCTAVDRDPLPTKGINKGPAHYNLTSTCHAGALAYSAHSPHPSSSPILPACRLHSVCLLHPEHDQCRDQPMGPRGSYDRVHDDSSTINYD
jgi:hypothetical protein